MNNETRSSNLYRSHSKYALTVTIILVILINFFLANAFSDLNSERYTIRSNGSLGLRIRLPGVYKSEVREIAVSRGLMGGCDWDMIAQTVKRYNFTTLAAPMIFNHLTYYPSQYVPQSSPRDELALAIHAAHSQGLNFRVTMGVLLKSLKDEWKVKRADGSLYNWLDPTNPEARDHVKKLVEELVTNYDFESFSLDYIRYDDRNMPYTETARQQFQEYLGENITDWPGPFAPNGTRWKEFLEWRIIPINTLVKEIHDIIKSIQPDIEIVAHVILWPYHPRWPRETVGQDWVVWVKEGYVDRVNPMTYRRNLDLIKGVIESYWEYGVSGPEGAVPLVPYLAIRQYDYEQKEIVNLSPEEFKAQVDLIRSLGVDGFAIIAYGGPGDDPNNPNPHPDIRPYLAILDLPKTFTMDSVTVTLNTTSAMITWTTSKPATSRIEYSTSPLFNASYEYDVPWFHYWDMNYYPGIFVENTAINTNHKIILSDLQEETFYYFRVQSQDSTGIATSEVYVFSF